MTTTSNETATSNGTATEKLALLDDMIVNEDDLTEEAKNLFPCHTDILNAFETYRHRILRAVNMSDLSRHYFFLTFSDFYTKTKQVLNYMAENNEHLSDNLPIVGPVVIAGLPRSGTTLLYNLLACDPNCRAPLITDMRIEVVPPIARSNSVEQERRAAIAKTMIQAYTDSNGSTDNKDETENELESSHPIYDIEEDYHFLCHGGAAIFNSQMILNDRLDFRDLLSDEMEKDFAYDYHKIFLRMLNSVDAPSSHWLLKSPVHTLYLDSLFRHYPNAAVIISHRNINEVLPSYCRMVFTLEKVYAIEVNSPSVRQALIAQYIEVINKMIECLIQFHSQQPKKNVFDVIYSDLMKQPIPTVRRIYDHFGLKWSDEFEISMQSWLRDNPQGKRGRNAYTLADLGLTHEDVEARYADYTNLFLRSSSSKIQSSPSSSTIN